MHVIEADPQDAVFRHHSPSIRLGRGIARIASFFADRPKRLRPASVADARLGEDSRSTALTAAGAIALKRLAGLGVPTRWRGDQFSSSETTPCPAPVLGHI